MGPIFGSSKRKVDTATIAASNEKPSSTRSGTKTVAPPKMACL